MDATSRAYRPEVRPPADPVRPSAVWFEQREQDRLADARAGEEHEQAVDAEPHTAHRRCAEFERREEVLVELHRLEVARRGRPGLLREAFALDDRIDELGEAGGALDAVDDEVPCLDQAR